MHGFAITDATTGELRECAETINRLLGEGKLRARIDRIMPLAGLRRRIVCSKSRRRKSMARSSSCLESADDSGRPQFLDSLRRVAQDLP